MPVVTYDPLRAGDAIDASSLNSRFSTVQSGINDLPESALAPGALNESHLPTFVLHKGSKSFGSSTHEYDGSKCQIILSTWATINEDGDHSGGGGTTGKDLEVAFGSNISFSSSGPIGGIFVLCDIHVKKLTYSGAPYGAREPVSYFRLQARRNGGAYETISRTERFVSNSWMSGATDSVTTWQHVPIRTFIKPGDLSGGDLFEAVRAQVTTWSGADATVFLRECKLTVLALKSTLGT